MATQATLNQPFPDLISVSNVVGLPFRDLVTPYVMTAVSDFTVDSLIVAGRFPTPPAALGFLLDIYNDEGETVYLLDGLESPYTIGGAVFPESGFLEPTIGQIWPRIG